MKHAGLRWGRAMLPLALVALPSPSLAQQRKAQPPRLIAANGAVSWNRYYTTAETNTILRDWVRRYPRLAKLSSIGKSFLGADLMVLELTNQETGAAGDKPALYLDGGLHAGELTGSAVALYTAGTVLARYGRDPAITRLLDTRTLYIRPKFNPDGADLVMAKDARLRSSVRPVDEDDDGVADEDPPEDLNGDGWITQMRVRDPSGDMKRSPADPRIMMPRQAGDSVGPFYFVGLEGIDNDHDGRYNEDGIGGIDLNRNFPRNWELDFIQPGAGPFPLSEPETYATIQFIDAHPNITAIVHGHTSGGFLYRLPSASDPSKFDRTDLDLIEELGAYYTSTTGRPVRASSTDPTDHRYGTLISWAYWDRGIIGWVPEYSPPNSWVLDYDSDGRITEEEALRFNDQTLGGRYFSPWKVFGHPQMGEVEIGGWHTRYWEQNPPPEYLENECAAQLPWILSLIEKSPRVTVSTPTIRPLGGDRYRVEVTVGNSGFLPTNLTQRGLAGRSLPGGAVADQIVHAPVATLELKGARIEGPARVTVGHLAGTSSHSPSVTEKLRTVSWTVRKTAKDATVAPVVRSATGGTARAAPVAF